MRVGPNAADIMMAVETFNASPDGQAERRRIQAITDGLPAGTLHLAGYWVCPDNSCGECYSCREVAE